MVTYVKISELPPATEATGDSELEVNQAGVTRKITVDQIADVIASILPPPDMSDYATDEEVADAIAAIPPDDWSEITGKPSTFPPTVPIPWADVSGKPATFPPTVPIAYTNISGTPTTLPPSGTAGGDLAGTYPNPLIKPSVTNGQVLTTTAGVAGWATPAAGGTGTVTSTSVVSANGFAGTVATATVTPAITLSTTITGLLKGNGAAISAATAGTDYVTPATNTVLQTVFTQTGAVATGTTIMPLDDTIPQITEGDQYMTLAITPKSATSKLVITTSAFVCNVTASNVVVGALFRDAVANALAASWIYVPVANLGGQLTFTHTMTSGTTSAITFRFRAGGAGAGTTTLNGQSSARQLGGVMASNIVIQEVAP